MWPQLAPPAPKNLAKPPRPLPRKFSHLNTLNRLQSQQHRLGLPAIQGVLASVNMKEARLHTAKKHLELADTDSAIVEIKPGAARAPHWHDTWEQQILVSGKAKTYLIDDKGQVHEEVLTQGMIALLPAGMTHWTETIGDQTAVLSLSFPAGFKTFELGDSLIQVRRNDKDCASGSNPTCGAKRKSLILIVKDGLI